jgi:hypothetical protein
MADSAWRGFRSFVRWSAICTQVVAFCNGTEVWQVLHVWA